MSDKPRRFWQIHLSTAVVLTLTAGFIMLVQMPYDNPQSKSYQAAIVEAKRRGARTFDRFDAHPSSRVQGWPLTFRQGGRLDWNDVLWLKVGIDAAVSLLIIGCIGVLAESRARQPSTTPILTRRMLIHAALPSALLLWLNMRERVVWWSEMPVLGRGWPDAFEWRVNDLTTNIEWRWLAQDTAVSLVLIALTVAAIGSLSRRKP
ncbi:MAG TPA: hypothetical protein VEJ63_10215 [Planctomycetota bacterium]|nr:hypothetical protein [Planctomycetota bacterium]